MNGFPPYSYFQQLQACLQWQTQKIIELEQKTDQLQKDMEQLSKQRPMSIDKIEYKFDQLKIEKLEGSLHIGVAPVGDKTIEDFNVNGKPIEPPMYRVDLFMRIQERIDRYLNEDCLNYIRELEGNYQIILGQDYRSMVIQDVRSQVSSRIETYLKDTPAGGSQRQDEIENHIVEKVISDIRTAIDRHLQNHKERRDEAQ